MGLAIGVVADDFTGATDVASMLVRGGMRTVQVIGVPDGPAPGADAVVVALKSRTAPVAQAVAESRAAWAWLKAAGAARAYFKVCSTFDSTTRGNIGPVAEALLDDLPPGVNLVCPAYPENGRTVYFGHLFVGDVLLSDSGMRDHPLTPMTDASLVRVMQAQSRRPVALLKHGVVARGAEAVREALAAAQAGGAAHVVADAIDDAALRVLAQACLDLPMVTAGSGIALGLPAALEARGLWSPSDGAGAHIEAPSGPAAVLSGSCSSATQGQVAAWRSAGRPALALDVRALARGEPVVEGAVSWAAGELAGAPVLIHATTDAASLRAVQAELGVERAGALVEQAMARLAKMLVAGGVRRLVVAGGETSGAVVQSLGVAQLRIGAPICPGVPWTQVPGRPLWLALKSGNFGGPGFFADALADGKAPA